MSILLLTSNSYADCGGVKFLNFELDSNREKININIQIIDSKKEIKLIFIVFLKNGESFQIVDPRLRSKTKKGKESDQIKWKFSDSKVLSKDDEKKIKNSGPSSVIKEIKVCNKKYWDTISLMDPIWPARAFKKYDRKGSIHPTALLAGAGILAAPIVGAYLRFKVAPDSYKTYQEERCNCQDATDKLNKAKTQTAIGYGLMAAPVVLYLVNRSIIKRKRKKIVEAIVQPTKDGASAYLQFRF